MFFSFSVYKMCYNINGKHASDAIFNAYIAFWMFSVIKDLITFF